MSNIPPSYRDLRASENGNPFGRLWNKLLERLDAQRIILKPGLTEESTGNGRAIGVTLQSVPPAADEIFYGLPASAWSSGTSITLSPCDRAGTTTGGDNVTVKLLASGSSYSIVNYDAGGGSAATGCTIPTTAIVAYTVIGDGTAYVVGEPAVVFPSPTDAFFRSISGKLQMRVRFQIGGALSTLSNWLDMVQSTPSKETACTAPGS